jgi:hypothetical protein
MAPTPPLSNKDKIYAVLWIVVFIGGVLLSIPWLARISDAWWNVYINYAKWAFNVPLIESKSDDARCSNLYYPYFVSTGVEEQTITKRIDCVDGKEVVSAEVKK